MRIDLSGAKQGHALGNEVHDTRCVDDAHQATHIHLDVHFSMQARLEEELRKRDLHASGNKQELVDRLHAALTVFLVRHHT